MIIKVKYFTPSQLWQSWELAVSVTSWWEHWIRLIVFLCVPFFLTSTPRTHSHRRLPQIETLWCPSGARGPCPHTEPPFCNPFTGTGELICLCPQNIKSLTRSLPHWTSYEAFCFNKKIVSKHFNDHFSGTICILVSVLTADLFHLLDKIRTLFLTFD